MTVSLRQPLSFGITDEERHRPLAEVIEAWARETHEYYLHGVGHAPPGSEWFHATLCAYANVLDLLAPGVLRALERDILEPLNQKRPESATVADTVADMGQTGEAEEG